MYFPNMKHVIENYNTYEAAWEYDTHSPTKQ